jgi:hypothetical protein
MTIICKYLLTVDFIFNGCFYSLAQAPIQLSVQTIEFTNPNELVVPTKKDAAKIGSALKIGLKNWNDFLDQETKGYKIVTGWVDPIMNTVDETVSAINPIASIPLKYGNKVREWINKNNEEDVNNFKRMRDFQVSSSFETAGKQIVEKCGGDKTCAETIYKRLESDPELLAQMKDGGDLGAYDEAKTRTFVKIATEKAMESFEGTATAVHDIGKILSETKTALNDKLVKINNDQKKVIQNTGKILAVQQEHTIALQNLQNTLNENFQAINNGIGNITALQQKNLFISGAILDGVVEIDSKITDLSASFAEMRAEQRVDKIKQIFENSPISKRIEELKNPNSAIASTLTQKERLDLLLDLEVIKKKQDIVNTCNIISEWGSVGKEALSVFCKNCPPVVGDGVNLGLAITDIVGNITTGNPAKAAMTALGIFRKPEPSAELQMLQQISRQLNIFEANMNKQFQEVHKHLLAIEEDLTKRLNIIDFKIDQISNEVFQMRADILKGLNRLEYKTDYVINQNECIKELILEIAQTQKVCNKPVTEFKKRIAEGTMNSFEQLNIFFRNWSCRGCVEALNNAFNSGLKNFPSFRYAQCNADGQDNKSRPDAIYSFLFQLFGANQANDVLVNSLLYIPDNIRVVDSLVNSLKGNLGTSPLKLVEEDRFYRNYKAVIAYADYLLTMFSFIELYDNENLMSPEQLRRDPAFTVARTQKMISMLDETLDLINRTIFQQSLMTGNGLFLKLDKMLSEGTQKVTTGDVNFSLSDAFKYNPFLRKNYSSYILNKDIGFRQLSAMAKSKDVKEISRHMVFKGYDLLLVEDKKTTTFQTRLTNASNPAEPIFLFNAYSPIVGKDIDQQSYVQSLKFSYPSSIVELLSKRNLIIDKLAEMHLISSPGLDKPGSELSRKDLELIILRFK